MKEKELSAIEKESKKFDDPTSPQNISFTAILLNFDYQEISKVTAHLQLDENRGALWPIAPENLDLFLRACLKNRER
jgi:hypothetical protein